MSKTEKASWRWDKPMRWGDIVRSLLIAGNVPDTRKKTMFELNALVKQRIEDGTVRQVSRGLYQLTKQPQL